jgi:alkylation response protein AidB-like acyl-CoA dehydrogenase
MDFDFSEEQRMLADSLGKLITDRYGFESRKAYVKQPEGWSRDIWAAYAEMGILGLPFAEADGGFGGGAVETMIVAEALGGALGLEPWFATVVLGGGFLRHGADATMREALVPQVAEGSLLLAFAHTEPQARFDLHHVETSATRQGDAWVLQGRKGVVLHGDVAGKLFVTARTAGGSRDESGIGVFLVDAGAAGLTRRGYATSDGLRAAEITFNGVLAEAVLGDPAVG